MFGSMRCCYCGRIHSFVDFYNECCVCPTCGKHEHECHKQRECGACHKKRVAEGKLPPQYVEFYRDGTVAFTLAIDMNQLSGGLPPQWEIPVEEAAISRTPSTKLARQCFDLRHEIVDLSFLEMRMVKNWDDYDTTKVKYFYVYRETL